MTSSEIIEKVQLRNSFKQINFEEIHLDIVIHLSQNRKWDTDDLIKWISESKYKDSIESVYF